MVVERFAYQAEADERSQQADGTMTGHTGTTTKLVEGKGARGSKQGEKAALGIGKGDKNAVCHAFAMP